MTRISDRYFLWYPGRSCTHVYDQHAQGAADDGDPIDKLDVDVRAIQTRVGEGRGINEEEEAQGELPAGSV